MLLSEEDRSGSSSCLRAKQALESTKAYWNHLAAIELYCDKGAN